MEEQRQIVLFSGGGWHYSSKGGFVMDEWLLSLTGRTLPKVCLLSTPQGDADGQFTRMFKELQGRAEVTWAPMFQELAKGEDPLHNLLAADLIYIPGGYTQGFVGALAGAGWDLVLRQAWEQGTVIAAMCAGAMGLCTNYANRWMEKPAMGAGLGFLPISLSVHANKKLYEDLGSMFRHGVRDGLIRPGYLIEDGFALRFMGTQLVECVTAEWPQARGYYLEPGDEFHELHSLELEAESLEERLGLNGVKDYWELSRRARAIKPERRLRLLRTRLSGENTQEFEAIEVDEESVLPVAPPPAFVSTDELIPADESLTPTSHFEVDPLP